MSSKKSRMGKMLDSVQKEILNSGAKKPRKPQKGLAVLPISPLDVSSIEKASSFEDEEVLSFGNPLHSTALEDDFSPNQGQKVAPEKKGAEGGVASRAETPRRARRLDEGQTPGRARAPPPTTSSAPKGGQPRTRRKSLGVKSSSRALQRVSEGPESGEATGRRRPSSSSGELIPLVSGEESSDDSDSASSGSAAQEPPPKRTKGVRGQAAPALPKKKRSIQPGGSVSSLGQETGRSRSSGSGPRESSTAGEQPASARAAAVRRRRRSSLSFEDLSEEDPSWHNQPDRKSSGPHAGERREPPGGRPNPGPEKRKSSSGSSGDAGPSNKNKRRERDVRNPIDLDVVLDAFLDFVSHYKETVGSGPVEQAIDAVSDMFEDQLTELITNTKELNSLRRENVKVNGTINKKRSRLLEIKSELITKETELSVRVRSFLGNSPVNPQEGDRAEEPGERAGAAAGEADRPAEGNHLPVCPEGPAQEIPGSLSEIPRPGGSVWPLQRAGSTAGGPWGSGSRAPAEEHQREPAEGPGPGQSALSSPVDPPLGPIGIELSSRSFSGANRH
ncbi:protein ENL isoform X2 [Anguilla rostrata]